MEILEEKPALCRSCAARGLAEGWEKRALCQACCEEEGQRGNSQLKKILFGNLANHNPPGL